MHVYILKAGPYFKVGKANDIQSRIQALQTGCPFHVECIACLIHESPHMVEALIHRDYHSQRGAGEWFVFSDQDLSLIVYEYGFVLCKQFIEAHSSELVGPLVVRHKREMQSIVDKKSFGELSARMLALNHALNSSWGFAKMGKHKLPHQAYLEIEIRETIKDILELTTLSLQRRRRLEREVESINQRYLNDEKVQKCIQYLDIKRKATESRQRWVLN